METERNPLRKAGSDLEATKMPSFFLSLHPPLPGIELRCKKCADFRISERDSDVWEGRSQSVWMIFWQGGVHTELMSADDESVSFFFSKVLRVVKMADKKRLRK